MAVLSQNGSGDIHWIGGKILIKYDSDDMARAVFESIGVDNYQYVHCSLNGSIISCEARSTSASKLLHTLDDLLACIIVAEEAYRTV